MANGKTLIMNRTAFIEVKEGRQFNKDKFNRFAVSDGADLKEYYETIVRHEVGHVVADQVFGQINGKKLLKTKLFGQTETQAIKALKEKPELIKKFFPSALDERIVNSYVKNFEKNKQFNSFFRKYRNSEDARLFSEYSFYEPGELFAESFAMKRLGEKLPKDINDFIENL